MADHYEIFSVCEMLKKRRQVPSVALVRSKLTQQVALPELIKAINAWKQGQDVPDAMLPSAFMDQNPSDLNHRVASLEAQVAEIRAQLEILLRKAP